ncbi:right-handed parallel beta-helix repeat-containing protein [Planomonospora sp. ID67723]|uniref:right-handed parallel beta-helix repeat-containing protein n=1 Tax=Planomonospora sp. ID67723 TaxID=2738134 RepID=UPI0018C3CCC2|nr:right-handed parallel beta-helix repeat-containing protein [Planomonospora sp. ID67723]MBG0829284.1 right-handed parallel beta-helix repeat-containing protein [Planomonospora sp. ID67723]
MRSLRRVATAVALTFGLLLPASAALAHEERPVAFPDGTGSVPARRTGEPDLLVCKTDRADFGRRIAAFPADLKQRNLELFERCQDSGYRHLQEAVDRVDRAGMNIAILPGVYLEEPSQPEPAGDCARLDARWSSWGYQILSFEQQKQCPHNQNLVAILGVEDLQIEGTGAGPLDVIIDAQYKKLNAIRADMTDGIYFRNFTAQRTTFNSLYILATDGFVIDTMLTRWNDEYGFLTFASDHGLYTDCESYGNGDSGIYPGSASDINDGRGHDVPRYAIEIRRCRSHHNMVGYSGTAGDSVYAHDNEFYENMGGASMDSAFAGHPGLPQNHARFERNKIYDNNQDYYRYVADGTCAKPPAERGYERGVVCPQIGMPPGTGVITAGGNWNVFRDNWIWGHDEAAFNLLAVPAFIRGEESWGKQFDTSHHNLYEGNRLGVSPAGESRPNGAGVSWDGQGTGNCWQRDVGPSTPWALPACGSAGPSRILSEPVKIAKNYLCNDYSIKDRRLPAGCDWYGSTGLARVEVQLALAGSLVLGLVAVLLRRRRLPSRAGLAVTLTGLAGLGLDVFGAAYEYTVLPAAALALMGVWWIGAGRLLSGSGMRGNRVFGWFTVALGALALADAFDKAIMMIPLLPVGPGWIRGLLTGVWTLWAIVLLAPRPRRTAPAGAAEKAVA